MSRLLTVALVLGPFLASAYAQERPAESKVLDRWVGKWKTEVVHKPTEAEPKETKTTGTITCKSILRGMFVEEAGSTSQDGVEHRVIWGYDPQRKVYRSWFFNSKNVSTTHDGQWDEKTSTMRWKADLGNGLTSEAEHHFLDANTYEWTLKVKDKSGKVQVDARGKHTRAE